MHTPTQRFLSLAHLSTWLLIIGYPVFWLELYVFKVTGGVTSLLAWGLFAVAVIVGLWHLVRGFKTWPNELGKFWLSLGLSQRLILFAVGFLVASILVVSTLAALYPIHLMQEFDTLNYHYTLPLQHLILGSFAHIPWAADDLFLLPIQFALAPFWFATSLPNKLPQLFLLFGLLAVLWGLTRRLSGGPWPGVLVLAAVLGSHGIGIQMGTAMLDLVIAYLFFAAIDSFLRRDMFLFVVEALFFFWSKSMVPLQMTLILLIMAVFFVAVNRHLKFFTDDSLGFLKRSLVWLAAGSLIVGGPFIVKSLYYAGTPLYPFMPGISPLQAQLQDNPIAWQSLVNAAAIWTDQIKDGYGNGRSPIDFIKHLWLIAVPEHGVNNRFDYPMGLPLLLFIGPFLVLLSQRLFKKDVPLAYLFIVASWMCWWFSSQQARFLYIPLMAMFIIVALEYKKPSRILLGALIVGLSLNLLSVYRAHAADLGKPFVGVLRSKDKKILELNKEYLASGQHGYVLLEEHDAAYAQFPVMIRKEKLPHTVAF